MLFIAIDGASRRNGKPDCMSAGGAFIVQLSEDFAPISASTIATFEEGSTNQRGELKGLIIVMEYLIKQDYEDKFALIVTDSEYIFNAMTKDWPGSWSRKGWVTAANEPVKNRDLWEHILKLTVELDEAGYDASYHYIKGHAISVGDVTAQQALNSDPSGMRLYKLAMVKYHASTIAVSKIQELSVKNNGFELSADQLRRFICANTVADAVATRCVVLADSTR